ncbi:unnamed protein product [Brassica rapa subsp. trilocularis]
MNSAKSNGKVGCLEQDLNQDRLISWSQHNQTDKEGRRMIIQAFQRNCLRRRRLL